ncbi:MAG: hypothetical protein J07HX64_01740 [halophilic archaeon J07HX64]|jgi:hypothetical protein|nr:MAG: hypothetical protein J07HX64_01740 [halophilic archaeon J07HX64]
MFEGQQQPCMYEVVGCDECQALWVVEGDPERSGCPRCGRTRLHKKRRAFVTTEDGDHAREVRASMLAARSGHGEAFAELGSFAQLDEQVDAAGIDDETYLEQSGIDPETVAEAGESGSTSQSRQEIVREAVRELDESTEERVVAHAEEHGVPSEYTERALRKLVETGEASKHRGRYRLL